jgi:hypothetical protein
MVTSTSHIVVVRGRRLHDDGIAAAQGVHAECRLVEEQDLESGVHDGGEVLHAIRPGMSRHIAGDDRDGIVAVGAVDDPAAAAADDEHFNLIEADLVGVVVSASTSRSRSPGRATVMVSVELTARRSPRAPIGFHLERCIEATRHSDPEY